MPPKNSQTKIGLLAINKKIPANKNSKATIADRLEDTMDAKKIFKKSPKIPPAPVGPFANKSDKVAVAPIIIQNAPKVLEPKAKKSVSLKDTNLNKKL